MCDGDQDCPDATDEFVRIMFLLCQIKWILMSFISARFQKIKKNNQNCTTTQHISLEICPVQHYLCNDKITCIDRQWLCDGGTDCPQGDDESVTNCQNKTCRTDQFQCNDMTCIPGHLMCSGAAECADGSDEVNCSKFLKNHR